MPATFRYRPIQADAPRLQGALLVVGFPTPGLVGLVAAHHLVESGVLPVVGALECDDLPPAVSVHDGRPLPPIRVHAGARVCGLDQDCSQLAVLIADVPLREDLQAAFAAGVVDWARRDGVASIVVFEAVPAEPRGAGEPKLVGAATTEAALAQLVEKGIEPLKGGTLGGPAAAFLAEGARREFPVFALFAQARPAIPDAGAGAVLLEAVDRFLLHIPIDVEPLKERARQLSEIVHAAAATHGAQAQDWARMYG